MFTTNIFQGFNGPDIASRFHRICGARSGKGNCGRSDEITSLPARLHEEGHRRCY